MIEQLSPIALFTYNRPEHTRQTVNALAKNMLAAESVLYIYADGPKKDISNTQYENLKQVRDYINNIKGFKKVYISENEVNLGLSQSIIKGVSEVINEHGKIIVLEDDLITGKGFLHYMNKALDLYADDRMVGCIHGWNYYLNANGYNEETFFLRGADCWGWATWLRDWSLFNENGIELCDSIVSKKLEYDFNRRNTHDFLNMLKDQINGKNDSWAIRWHASLFLENKYCLHPVKSLVKNIGLDVGTHCNYIHIEQSITDDICINKIPVEEAEWFFKAYRQYQKNQTEQWPKLKASLKQLFHR